MMTVVAIVFAILLMILTLASTQFSLRILVSFIRDRVAHRPACAQSAKEERNCFHVRNNRLSPNVSFPESLCRRRRQFQQRGARRKFV